MNTASNTSQKLSKSSLKLFILYLLQFCHFAQPVIEKFDDLDFYQFRIQSFTSIDDKKHIVIFSALEIDRGSITIQTLDAFEVRYAPVQRSLKTSGTPYRVGLIVFETKKDLTSFGSLIKKLKAAADSNETTTEIIKELKGKNIKANIKKMQAKFNPEYGNKELKKYDFMFDNPLNFAIEKKEIFFKIKLRLNKGRLPIELSKIKFTAYPINKNHWIFSNIYHNVRGSEKNMRLFNLILEGLVVEEETLDLDTETGVSPMAHNVDDQNSDNMEPNKKPNDNNGNNPENDLNDVNVITEEKSGGKWYQSIWLIVLIVLILLAFSVAITWQIVKYTYLKKFNKYRVAPVVQVDNVKHK